MCFNVAHKRSKMNDFDAHYCISAAPRHRIVCRVIFVNLQIIAFYILWCKRMWNMKWMTRKCMFVEKCFVFFLVSFSYCDPLCSNFFLLIYFWNICSWVLILFAKLKDKLTSANDTYTHTKRRKLIIISKNHFRSLCVRLPAWQPRNI